MKDMFGVEWVVFTKRTGDPKLRYIEHRLDLMGIAHQRRGFSFHGPILMVPAKDEERAWGLLMEKVGKRVLDDIPDDDRIFKGVM